MKIRWMSRLFVPFALFLIVILIPTPEGLSRDAHLMFGVLAFAASIFLLQPIPLGLSGILVLIMPMVLGVSTAGKVFSTFGNSAVFFLIGAFIMAASIERTSLHKRVSLQFLKLSGRSPKLFVLSTMLTGATLSMLMPEHGVIVLIIPILMFIMVGMGLSGFESNFAKSVMIGAAYGCSIGSIVTPLGGARNPLTIAFLDSQGLEVSFLNWMVISAPVAVVSLFLVWLLLIRFFPPEMDSLETGQSLIRDEVGKLKRPTRYNISIIAVLGLSILSWMILPHFFGVNISLIALIGGIAMFVVGGLKWEDVESRIPWGIILLYGGAISMGVHLADTGGAEWIADKMLSLTGGSALLSIIFIVALTKLLTEVMSNTAAVSILLPIGYGIALGTGLPPIMTCMLVGLSGGLAFMFLISTPGNLISYSAGYFTQKDLFKVGIAANLITIIVVVIMAYTYWKIIGVW
mgnify:CR=1 FL=1